MTRDTSLISIPRPATSVATMMSLAPPFKLARAYSLCSWPFPPCSVVALYYQQKKVMSDPITNKTHTPLSTHTHMHTHMHTHIYTHSLKHPPTGDDKANKVKHIHIMHSILPDGINIAIFEPLSTLFSFCFFLFFSFFYFYFFTLLQVSLTFLVKCYSSLIKK